MRIFFSVISLMKKKTKKAKETEKKTQLKGAFNSEPFFLILSNIREKKIIFLIETDGKISDEIPSPKKHFVSCIGTRRVRIFCVYIYG